MSGEAKPDDQVADDNPGALQDLDGTKQNNKERSNKKTRNSHKREKKTDETDPMKEEKNSAEQSTEPDKLEPINNKRVPAPRTKIVISPRGKTSEETVNKTGDKSTYSAENEPSQKPVPTKSSHGEPDSRPKEAAPPVVPQEKPVSVKAPVVAVQEKTVPVNEPKPVARSTEVVQGAVENAIVRDQSAPKENTVATMDPSPKLNLNPMAVEFVPAKTAKPKAVPGDAVPAPRNPLSSTNINRPE